MMEDQPHNSVRNRQSVTSGDCGTASRVGPPLALGPPARGLVPSLWHPRRARDRGEQKDLRAPPSNCRSPSAEGA